MENQFKVTYHIGNDEGKSMVFNSVVEFSHDPDTYGNGWYMGIEGKDESFGFGTYDIRYDTNFRRDQMLLYIAQFYAYRYTGKNGSYKLMGIKISESELTDEEVKEFISLT